MERRYILTFVLSSLFLFGFPISALPAQAQQTFEGIGDLTTDTFDCPGISRITWTTDYDDPEWALFSVFINKLGEDLFYESFAGLEGTTYLYEEGTFYFEVIASSLNSWHITVEALESLEPNTYFSGSGNLNTGTFTCTEHCVITWTTEYNNTEWAMFSVFIKKLGDDLFYESFDGLNGTTHLYTKGTFYFEVLASNLEQWEISVEEVVVYSKTTTPKPETTKSTTPEVPELIYLLPVLMGSVGIAIWAKRQWK